MNDILANPPSLITIAVLLIGVALAGRVIKVLCVVGALLLAAGYVTGNLPW